MPEIEWRLGKPQTDKGATRPDVLASQRASRQHGVISTRQLRDCGLDAMAVRVRVDRGQLHPLFRGVYAVGHDALAQSGRFTAAVLACGDGAVLSDHAAAAHLDMREYDGRVVQVTVPGSGGRKVSGIRVRRAQLDPRDIWTRDGIRVTCPARTILDIAATMPAAELRRMVRQAQVDQHVNVRQLLEILARCRGHRGAAKLRAVIADGPSPTRSLHEDQMLDLIAQGGIERPQINPKLRFGGRPIEPDLLWPAPRLVVECDSRRWHSDPLTQQDDADKQAILEAHGFRVLRVTWHQVVGHPQQTLARVRQALEAAAAPPPLSGGRSGS